MKSVVVPVIVLALAVNSFANMAPHAPVIIEPPPDSARAIDPGDVHMATAPFVDDDSQDRLACSDWQIVDETGAVAWHADCVTGTLAVHIHLGDGAFTVTEGHLFGNTNYVVRVRFSDSSGDPTSQWSEWSTRPFVTSAGSTIHPLRIVDILSSPLPRLGSPAGPDPTLTKGSSIALRSEAGDLLLSFDAVTGVTNPPSLPDHADVQAVITSGPDRLSLGETNIDFADQDGNGHTVCLPPVDLAPGTSTAFWIAEDGSSFQAAAADDTPEFTSLARAGDTPWSVSEPGYRVERVAAGLQLPVNIAFVPHPATDADAPLFYITELYGTIRAVLRDGTLKDYATGLLNFDPTGIFPGSGEHGIVGTVVDPATGDLFVAVVYQSSVDGAHDPRVIRLHSIDGGRTASAVSTVLDMPLDPVGPSHQISSLSIGFDGLLYVQVGDADQIWPSRDLRFFRGKILRCNLDGTAPDTNPFFDAGDGITATDYVLAYGFRNPFGGAWRERDASLYEVENGPDVDRLARVSPGFDYHWAGSDDDMRVGAAYNWDVSVAPVNIAFIQQATFAGSGFPAAKFDHAFVSESGPTWASGTPPLGKRIGEFAFDGSTVVPVPPFLEYTGTGHSTVAALAAGPDGLYFSDLYPEQGAPTGHGANVYRIRYVGQATIGAYVTDQASRTVAFSAAITVPGYKNLTWDFGDGSGNTEAASEHTFPANGPYDVRLSVTGANDVAVEDYTRIDFPGTAGSGLIATYSDEQGDQVSRIDSNVDFDWQTTPVPIAAPQFNVKWSGEIVPSISGLYTFAIHTEGSGVLRVDDRTVIDSGASDPGALTNPVRLEAGTRYPFTLTIEDDGVAGPTQLLWTVGALPLRVVPSTAFYKPLMRQRAVAH